MVPPEQQSGDGDVGFWKFAGGLFVHSYDTVRNSFPCVWSSLVPMWMMMFYGLFRVDWQRSWSAPLVVGHQNLPTLYVGKSCQWCKNFPFESIKMAV